MFSAGLASWGQSATELELAGNHCVISVKARLVRMLTGWRYGWCCRWGCVICRPLFCWLLCRPWFIWVAACLPAPNWLSHLTDLLPLNWLKLPTEWCAG